MALISLALKSLRNRWFSAFLCVLTIGLSTALLLAVEHIRASARSSFQSTVSGTDLIVGARTGAVPLMLYTVFHVGEASNNVSWASYQRYANLSSVRWTIPISLGDSYQGFRVVGTTDAMFAHYRFGAKRALAFAQGQAFNNTDAQAVVGSAVAEKLGLTLGAKLAVSHGLGNVGFIKHAHAQQTLVGVLAATGTPVDQSVFVNLAAIDSMHAGFDGSARVLTAKTDLGHDHADHADHNVEIAPDANVPSTPKAITAFFVGLKARPMALALQRHVMFCAFAAASVFGGRALTRRRASEPDSADHLNALSRDLIGRTVRLDQAIINGEGRVKIGDKIWRAHGKDTAAGIEVKIVRLDGSALVVEAI